MPPHVAQLHPWSAEFRDPLRERAFREQELAQAVPSLYVGCAVVFLANVAAAWMEWYAFWPQSPSRFWCALTARTGVMAGVGAVIMALRWWRRPSAIEWTLLAVITSIATMQTTIDYLNAIADIQGRGGIFWFALFAFLTVTVLPVSFRFRLVFAGLLCVPPTVVHAFVLGDSMIGIGRVAFALGISAVVALGFRNRMGASRRREFALLERQQQINTLLQGVVERQTVDADRLKKDKSELEARLEQAQRLEALGRLAGGVAHDLNNALTPVMGYASIARNKLLKQDPRVAEMMSEIINAADSARNMVQQLLAFGCKQTLDAQPLDLSRVAAEHEGMVRKLVRSTVQVRFDVPDRPLVVEADRTKLGQVIANLTVNASDAMPSGGTLVVRLACEQVEHAAGELAGGSYAVLHVEDSGSGMDEATQKHIFEPYFTTKQDGHAGLGLATVYGIVQQHRGAIRVSARPGEGTRFSIYLRLIDAAVVPRPESPPRVTSAPRRCWETILWTEDDEDIRRLVAVMLHESGYQVLSADSGESALTLARATSGPIHVLLSDVSMPGMLGPELWSTLRDERKETKALFVSGYTSRVFGKDPADDGRVAFLQKPFTQQDLLRELDQLLTAARP